MAEITKVSSFEIRLHKADNTVSIVMTVNAFGQDDARLQAQKMLKEDIAYAVVWQGLTQVSTVHRVKPS